jgi:hypothetical protein
MRTRTSNTGRLRVSAIVVLAALLFRAYVPVGFMPAGGAPFRVELCPASGVLLPSQHAHHHDSGHDSRHHANFQECPFGSAPAQGPVSHLVVLVAPADIPFLEASAGEPQRLVIRSPRAHRPRGPPALA